MLVRFLTQNNPKQSAAATEFMNGQSVDAPGHICREVLVELVLVFERAYRLPRADIVAAVEGQLSAKELIVEAETRTSIAMSRYARGGTGFADQMIALGNEEISCTATVSFDHAAAADAGMQRLGQGAARGSWGFPRKFGQRLIERLHVHFLSKSGV